MAAPDITVALVGRPNCGKTTLFNALTGDHQWVGNWPGVTVEGVRGTFTHQGRCIEVMDLPGAYTLTGTRSLDEQVTADYLSGGHCDVVINVVDAASPERSLYLTAQVLESQGCLADDPADRRGVPVVVALNRLDRATADGIQVDCPALEQYLGCPVLSLSAAHGQGIDAVKDAIIAAVGGSVPAFPDYGPAIMGLLRPHCTDAGSSARWSAIRILEDDNQGDASHADALALGAARHAFAAMAAHRGITRTQQNRRKFSDQLDAVLMHPVLGVLAFLAVMYVMFLWTIHLGGAFVDACDGIIGAIFEVGGVRLLEHFGAPDWLVLIAEGGGRGARTMASFVPLVLFLYLFLAVLEETGYMSRAAVVMDRFMRRIGLPGKAFVPLVVGLGCNVPAVMAARTLEDPEDRKATIAMTPFMSCGARLPVYALFAAIFFPSSGQNLVFALYLIGILVAVFTGFVLKRTVFAGNVPPLLLELPAYHRPQFRAVARRGWDRVVAFALDAGKVVVPVVMLLTALNAVTLDGRIQRGAVAGDTLLSAISRQVTPLMAPLGIEPDNWQATVGLFTGIFAKEALVGTLAALYADNGAAAQADADVQSLVADALATIPANIAALVQSWSDPLGLAKEGIGDDSRGADRGASDGMSKSFDGTAGAFAYLVFVLLYAPCVATIAAIRRESGVAWTVFVLGWTTLMGYSLSTLTYQLLVFSRHPWQSTLWSGMALGMIGLAVWALRRYGNRLKGVSSCPTTCGGCSKGGCH